MLKWMFLMAVLCWLNAFNAFDAQAQRRGYGPTRADRDRWQHTPLPQFPPHHSTHHLPLMHASPLALIEIAARGDLLGCSVSLLADGYRHHLYIRGSYAGSFRAQVDDLDLAATLESQIRRGICQLRNHWDREEYIRARALSYPDLIGAFARGVSQNCHVRLGVSGWANQIYINGRFSGNYDQYHEREKLRHDLANMIASGACHFPI